jgi:hypothetical protein
MREFKNCTEKATRRLQRIVFGLRPHEAIIANCVDQGERFECMLHRRRWEHVFAVRFWAPSSVTKAQLVEDCCAAMCLLSARRDKFAHDWRAAEMETPRDPNVQ